MSLLNWIPRSINLEYMMFNSNPAAKHYIRERFEKIPYDVFEIVESFFDTTEQKKDSLIPMELESVEYLLSVHSETLDYLYLHPEKISWSHLFENPAAMPFLIKNLDKIHKFEFSRNEGALGFLLSNRHLIDVCGFCRNPAAQRYFRLSRDEIFRTLCNSQNAIDFMIDQRSLLTEPQPEPHPEPQPNSEEFNVYDLSGTELLNLVLERDSYELNVDPNNLDYLRDHPEKINLKWLALNPGIFE